MEVLDAYKFINICKFASPVYFLLMCNIYAVYLFLCLVKVRVVLFLCLCSSGDGRGIFCLFLTPWKCF